MDGWDNPLSPVPGHEAHVSFRRAAPTDPLHQAFLKSQVSRAAAALPDEAQRSRWAAFDVC